jgi:uncharacterized small protein (DUF1192 family)
MNYNELVVELRVFENRYALFKAQGDYLQNCSLDSTVVRGEEYYRLWESKNGKSLCIRVLKPDEVLSVKDAIWRGKHIKFLDQEIARIRAELQNFEQKIIASEAFLTSDLRSRNQV